MGGREQREQSEDEERRMASAPGRGRRWRESERGTRWAGRVAGRQIRCASAPPGGQSGGSRSAFPGRWGGLTRRPPPSLTFLWSPRVQARLEHSLTLLSSWARRQDFWAPAHRPPPPCPGPGGWVVRMYSIILFWKLDASSFLILYKEETNKVCFCVYCLFIVL